MKQRPVARAPTARPDAAPSVASALVALVAIESRRRTARRPSCLSRRLSLCDVNRRVGHPDRNLARDNFGKPGERARTTAGLSDSLCRAMVAGRAPQSCLSERPTAATASHRTNAALPRRCGTGSALATIASAASNKSSSVLPDDDTAADGAEGSDPKAGAARRVIALGQEHAPRSPPPMTPMVAKGSRDAHTGGPVPCRQGDHATRRGETTKAIARMSAAGIERD
jgi:hypothetical protein